MSRTHVRFPRWAWVALLAGALTLWAPTLGHGLTARSSPAAQHRYVVRPGDTLWSIARRIHDGDPRALVDAIQSANGTDPGALVPGQVLLIPATG
jgi:nucleoid-associated protein YgaU